MKLNKKSLFFKYYITKFYKLNILNKITLYKKKFLINNFFCLIKVQKLNTFWCEHLYSVCKIFQLNIIIYNKLDKFILTPNIKNNFLRINKLSNKQTLFIYTNNFLNLILFFDKFLIHNEFNIEIEKIYFKNKFNFFSWIFVKNLVNLFFRYTTCNLWILLCNFNFLIFYIWKIYFNLINKFNFFNYIYICIHLRIKWQLYTKQ